MRSGRCAWLLLAWAFWGLVGWVGCAPSSAPPAAQRPAAERPAPDATDNAAAPESDTAADTSAGDEQATTEPPATDTQVDAEEPAAPLELAAPGQAASPPAAPAAPVTDSADAVVEPEAVTVAPDEAEALAPESEAVVEPEDVEPEVAESVAATAETASSETAAPEAAPEALTSDAAAAAEAEAAVDAVPAIPAETQLAAASRAEMGRELYLRHCGACHGDDGNGAGVAAQYVFPKPRNFQLGRFKLVTTENNVPSRDDLHAVLLRGMPGSSMPPWGHLSQEQREAIVDEVMRLRADGARSSYTNMLREEEELTDEELQAEDVLEEIEEYVTQVTTPGASTELPEIGPPTPEGLERGKELYAKYGCLQCHGPDGKGQGVEKMVDDDGYPTAPRDFTVGIFKGGHDPGSIYRRIAYGLPGTPMPNANQLTPEQKIDLVHYVLGMSTEEQREAAVLKREKIVAAAKAELPASPQDPAWLAVRPVTVRTMPLWWRDDSDIDLQVQAVHDGQTLAVRLSWKDAQEDGHATSSQAFEDAAAIQLYRGAAEPFLGMGQAGAAVDVWFWDADRQGQPLAVEELYPQMVVDIYPFSEAAVASAELDRDGARTADQPDISLPARAAGNQIVPTNDASGASSLAAGGPGSSTFRLPRNQSVVAVGEWLDGRWHVVMTRPLGAAGEGVSLAPGDAVSMALAVWDGAQDDRDGKKLISIWQDLILEN